MKRIHFNLFAAGLMALYLVLLKWVEAIFRSVHPHGTAAVLLAIVPAVPILGVLVSFGIYIVGQSDEVDRQMRIQGLAWGAAATIGVTTVWGFLEVFANVQRLPIFDILPLFLLMAGLSTALVRLRYR